MAVDEFRQRTGIYKVQWDWTSTSTGTVSEATTYSYNGQIIRAIFAPDAGGTQPTDAYDVTVTDSDGYDVLHGLGANLSNAANVYKTNGDGLSCMTSSTLTLVIANAGDTKGGVVTLYLVPFDFRGIN